jgi:hypothetical protein
MTPIFAHRLRLDKDARPPQIVEVGPVEVLPIHVDTDATIALAALEQRYPVNVPDAVRDELLAKYRIVRV